MKKILPIFIISLILLTSCGNDAKPTIYDIRNKEVDVINQTNLPEVKTILNTENKGLADYQTQKKEAEVLFESEGKIHSSILINDGVLFFGNENCDFYAIDIKTKKKKWQYKSDDKVETMPIFTDGKIIFNSGNSLYILNAKNGKQIGKVTHASKNEGRLSEENYSFNDSKTAINASTAYFIALNGDLVAVDINSGKEIWSVKTKDNSPADSGINYYDGKLYWCDSLKMFNCFDISKKEMKYQIDLGGRIFAPMLIDHGKIYIAGRNCIMYCIEGESGKVLWRSHSVDKSTWFSGGSVCMGDTLYSCTSDEYTLVSFNKNTGEFNRIYPTETNAYTSPVINNDNIIVAATDVYRLNKSYIMEFDTKNNTKLWQTELPDCVLSSPAIYDNAVYFGSDSGKIYSIKCYN